MTYSLCLLQVDHVSIVNKSGSKPGKVVVRVAQEEDVDMVVVGSKGRGGIAGRSLWVPGAGRSL